MSTMLSQTTQKKRTSQPLKWLQANWFDVLNYTILTLLSISCLLPIIHVFGISLSSAHAVSAGRVLFWPVDFTTSSYEFVLRKKEFLDAFLVTLKRVAIGVTINMVLTMLVAYPLSKDPKQFRLRTPYVWYFVFTMLFSGGMIPTYIVVKQTGVMDTIWALILPGALPIFNMILLLNFFRSLPKELEESATIDGAGPFQTLWRIYAPLSMPALATIGLFATVSHWNSWFDGLIYMSKTANYPLQSYLQTVIIKDDVMLFDMDSLDLRDEINKQTNKAAQIFIGMLPILLAYPFLQRYFVKGIVLGSVKE